MTREVPNRAEEEKDHIAQKGTPNITGGGGRRRKRRLPPASAKLGLPCSLLKGAGQQTEKTSPKKIKRGKKAKHFRVRVAERERESRLRRPTAPAPTPSVSRAGGGMQNLFVGHVGTSAVTVTAFRSNSEVREGVKGASGVCLSVRPSGATAAVTPPTVFARFIPLSIRFIPMTTNTSITD